MKIAAFGDVHANLFSEFAIPDEQFVNSRMRYILSTFEQMGAYCNEHKINLVLMAGDLYHKRNGVDTRVSNLVRDAITMLGELGIFVVMIPGNHDQVDNTDYPQHSLYSFKEFSHVKVLDRFIPHELTIKPDTIVYPVPYSKNALMVKDYINKYVDDAKYAKEHLNATTILLAHLGVSGAFVGKENYAMADAFTVEDLHPEVFDYGVLGHFHRSQFLEGTKNFFYTGAPIQHNFNDEGQDKGFWVIDTELKTIDLVPIKSPKFMTITDWQKVYKKTKFNDLLGDYLRISVNADDVDKLVKKLPEGLDYRLEIEKVFKEEKRLDVDISMSFSEIIAKYADKFKPEAKDIGLDILREAESA